MAGDFLNTYKYGWKTSYYQNTYDSKKDADEDLDDKKTKLENLLTEIESTDEEDCESCKI